MLSICIWQLVRKFEVQISHRWLCFPRAELAEGLSAGTCAEPLVSSAVVSRSWGSHIPAAKRGGWALGVFLVSPRHLRALRGL